MNKKKQIEKTITIIEKKVIKFRKPAVTNAADNEKNPYKVLIACLLSLRTKDEITDKAAPRLFKLADSPEKMLELSTKQIEKAIYPVGFYRTKAIRIKEISKVLIEKYNSQVPNEIDELLKLKGVGRKTANIVLVYAYNKLALPIDTHCHRIPNRLGWIKTKTPEQTEEVLGRIIPKKYWKVFNDTFVTFGQNICVPIKPKCWTCPITEYCEYYRKVYSPSVKKK